MIPSVGRTVHYTSLGSAGGEYPPEQQAAIITAVKKLPLKDPTQHTEHDYEVCLHVFYRTGDFFMENVPFRRNYKPGHWTWAPGIS